MELQQAINTRRSVRNYTNQPVSKEAINALLNAAVQAPSAMNTQPWVFAVIQDATELAKISDRAKQHLLESLTATSPLSKYRETLQDPNFNIFYGASTLVLILGKPTGPRPVEDCQLAAENLMLTACANGLGTCFIGFASLYLDSPAGKREYGIPDDYQVAAAIIVGTPKDPLGLLPKNPPEVLFWNEAKA